jgi:hypothetical protein
VPVHARILAEIKNARSPGHEDVLRPHGPVAVSAISPVQSVRDLLDPHLHNLSSPASDQKPLKPLFHGAKALEKIAGYFPHRAMLEHPEQSDQPVIRRIRFQSTRSFETSGSGLGSQNVPAKIV